MRGTLNGDDTANFQNAVTAGTMNLRSARLYDTSANGVGILFSPGASGAGDILPTDKDGQLVNLGPSIGSATRKFNKAHFAGSVTSATTVNQTGTQFHGYSLQKADGVKVGSIVGLAADNDNGCLTLYKDGAKEPKSRPMA